MVCGLLNEPKHQLNMHGFASSLAGLGDVDMVLSLTKSLYTRIALAGTLALLSIASLSRAQVSRQSNDFNQDGVADQIVAVEGHSTSSSSAGSVIVTASGSGTQLFSVSGPGENQRFGRAASGWIFVPATPPELLVAAPEAPGASAGASGRVFSFVLGQVAPRVSVQAGSGQRFTDRFAVIADQDGDSYGELLVEGAELVNGSWEYRTFVYSGASGASLIDRQVTIDALVRFAGGGGKVFLRTDLNDDGIINQEDVIDLVSRVGQSSSTGSQFDLDNNGAINVFDVHVLVDAMLRGDRTIVVSGAAFQTGEDWSAAMSHWQSLYGSTSLTNSLVNNNTGGGQTGFPGLLPCGNAIGEVNNQCIAQIQGCPLTPLIPGQIIQLASGGYSGPDAACSFSILSNPGNILEEVGSGRFQAQSTSTGGCATVVLNCVNGGITCCQICQICVSPSVGCPEGLLLLDGCPSTTVVINDLEQMTLSAFLGSMSNAVRVEWDMVLLPVIQELCTPDEFCGNWTCGDCPTAHELSLRSHPRYQSIVSELQAASNTDEARVVCVRARWYSVVQTAAGPVACIKCASCNVRVGLKDSDGDGIRDVDELGMPLSTDPLNPDSDGDGFCDGDERRAGSDPTVVYSIPTTGRGDSDVDGLPDIEDVRARRGYNAADGRVENFDNDYDGVPDAAELDLGLNPLSAFTFGEGNPDVLLPLAKAADKDQDRVDDKYELRRGLNPFVRDMDGDGIPDGIELRVGTDPRTSHRTESTDSDGDGLCDYEEITFYGSNNLSHDSDGDGLSDLFEVKAGLDPIRAYSRGRMLPNGTFIPGVPDRDADLDHDGLSNLTESRFGTDPLLPDTDGDGATDGQEVGFGIAGGTGGDPLDPSDGGQGNPDEYCWVMVTVGGHWTGALDSGDVCTGGGNLWNTGDIRTIEGGLGGGINDQKHPHVWEVHIGSGGSGTGSGGGSSSLAPPIKTGPNGEREIGFRRLRKGMCFPVTIGGGATTTGQGSSGAPNGIFVGFLPVDMTQPNAPACLSCCCITQSPSTNPQFPDGILGSYCGTTVSPSGQTTNVCLGSYTPNPETHLDASYLGILPGDEETFTVTGLQAGSQLTIADPTVAKFVTGGSLAASVAAESTTSFVVRGLKNGTTAIRASNNGCSLPVLVGGKVTVSYNQAPTFKIAPSPGGDGPNPGALGGAAGGPPLPPSNDPGLVDGWYSFHLGGRPPMPTALIQEANTYPEVTAQFRVEVIDANGRVKKGKRVVIVSRDEFIQFPALGPGPGGLRVDAGLTNQKGRVQATMGTNAQKIEQYLLSLPGVQAEYLNEYGVAKDQVAVLVGKTAQEFMTGAFAKPQLNEIIATNEYVVTSHTFTGHSLVYSRDLETVEGATYRTTVALQLPAVNHAQFMLIAKHFVGGVMGSTNLPPSTVIPHINRNFLPGTQVETSTVVGEPPLTYEQYINQPADVNAPLGQRAHPALFEHFLARLQAQYDDPTNELRDRPLEDGTPDASWTFPVELSQGPVDPADPPVGWSDKVISGGAIVAELAIGVIPGADLIDLSKEMWKFFNGEAIDKVTVGLAAAGLAMDLIPGNVFGNLAVGALKVVAKIVGPDNFVMLMKLGGSVENAVFTMYEMMKQFSGTVTEKATAFVSGLASGVWMARNSAVELSENAIRAAFEFMERRGISRLLNAPANGPRPNVAEAYAYAAMHNRVAALESVYDEWPSWSKETFNALDEATQRRIQATLESVLELNIEGGQISDDAVRGLVSSFRVNGNTEATRELAAAFNPRNPGRLLSDALAEQCYSQIERLKNVPNCDKHIRDLKNNISSDPSNAVSQFRGVLFEGHVAIKVLDGQVPGAGALNRVADSGVGDKIDVLSENFAMQTKRSDNAAATMDVSNRADIRALATQASGLIPERTPVLILNKPPTPELLSFCNDPAHPIVRIIVVPD